MKHVVASTTARLKSVAREIPAEDAIGREDMETGVGVIV